MQNPNSGIYLWRLWCIVNYITVLPCIFVSTRSHIKRSAPAVKWQIDSWLNASVVRRRREVRLMRRGVSGQRRQRHLVADRHINPTLIRFRLTQRARDVGTGFCQRSPCWRCMALSLPQRVSATGWRRWHWLLLLVAFGCRKWWRWQHVIPSDDIEITRSPLDGRVCGLIIIIKASANVDFKSK